MQSLYLEGKPPLPLKDKTVIVVDDGIATGKTLQMGIELIKKSHPSKIIVAAPVSASNALETLKTVCDEVICLLSPEYFGGVGAFYEDFSEVTDEMVVKYMKDMRMNHSAFK